MNYIEQEIDTVLQRLGIAPSAFTKLGRNEAAAISQRAQAEFVAGNPRVWWLSLKHPKRVDYFSDDTGSLHLLEYIPAKDKRCWFIPETEEPSLPVYDAQADLIPWLISECFFFEYYLVGPDCDWVLIENDHKEIIFSQAKITQI